MPRPPTAQPAVSTQELLDVLGIGRTTLYRWIARGLLLPPEGHEGTPRYGGRARWPAAALQRAKKVRALVDAGYTLDAIAQKLEA